VTVKKINTIQHTFIIVVIIITIINFVLEIPIKNKDFVTSNGQYLP